VEETHMMNCYAARCCISFVTTFIASSLIFISDWPTIAAF